MAWYVQYNANTGEIMALVSSATPPPCETQLEVLGDLAAILHVDVAAKEVVYADIVPQVIDGVLDGV